MFFSNDIKDQHKNLKETEIVRYKRGPHCDLKEGVEVIILILERSNKLKVGWKEPCRVLKELNDVDLLVELGRSRKRLVVCQVKLLRKIS